jgi:hypothetical protein
LIRLPFAPDPHDGARDRGLTQDPRERDLCSGSSAPLADRAQRGAKRAEVERGERMAAAEVVRVERFEVEVVGKRSRSQAAPM